MNEIIEFAEKEERRRAEEIAETCKGIIKGIIVIFLIMSGLCATNIMPAWLMYPYIIIGGIVLIVSTIMLAVQDMKLSCYDEEEDEYEE